MDYETWSRCSDNGTLLDVKYFEQNFSKNKNIRVIFDGPIPSSQADLERCQIEVGEMITIHLTRGLPALYYPERLKGLLPILERFAERHPHVRGMNVSANIGDEGEDDSSLAYSSRFPSSNLIPDPDFILSSAYKDEKRSAENALSRTNHRKAVAYWRGTDSGVRHYPDFRMAPRVIVAMLSRAHGDKIDAGITAVEPRANQQECQDYYNENGLIKDFQPPQTMLEYQYQIDIDGNSNAWRGFYLKLLSGSPVFKVRSGLGYRQWYYSRLQPWINFIPVEPDASDLVDKIGFLQLRPDLAKSIADCARALTATMTLDFELDLAAATVLKACYRL